MSTTETKPKRKFGQPDPDGSLPCVSCGRKVREPDRARTESVRIWSRQTAMEEAFGHPAQFTDVPATRCDRCTHRRVFAAALLAKHPRVERGHGNVAIDRLDAALAALDVAGLFGGMGRMLTQLTEDDQRLRDLMRFMTELGAEASWVAQRVPTPSAKPYGHVSKELSKEIGVALKRLIRRPFEPTLMIVPPGSLEGMTLPGCLFCGLDVIKVRESDSTGVWGQRLRVDPGTVGGMTRPEMVEGHLCPRCRNSADAEGAIGLPALTRALLSHLGYHAVPGWSISIDKLKAFAALRPGTEPNTIPWTHLDTAKIADALGRTLGVRPNERGGGA
jgi:hypothetical protein